MEKGPPGAQEEDGRGRGPPREAHARPGRRGRGGRRRARPHLRRGPGDGGRVAPGANETRRVPRHVLARGEAARGDRGRAREPQEGLDCDDEVRDEPPAQEARRGADRKSTRLNSSHGYISYAVFCLKKIQIKLLKKTVSHLYKNSPFYRKKIGSLPYIKAIDDISMFFFKKKGAPQNFTSFPPRAPFNN